MLDSEKTREQLVVELEEAKAELQALRDQRSFLIGNKLRCILEAIPDMIFVMRRDTTFIDYIGSINNALSEEPEYFIGKKPRDILPLDIAENAELLTEMAFNTNEMQYYTYTMVFDGIEHAYEARGCVCSGDTMVWIVRDVTKNRIIQAELRHQSDFLRTVVDSLDHRFYVIDAQSSAIVLSNLRAKQAGICEGMHCCNAHSLGAVPCRVPRALCPLKQVCESHDSVTFQVIDETNPQSLKYIEIHAQPIFDKTGNVAQIIEYQLDLTERRKTQEELKKLYHAVEQCPVSIVITDRNGIIEYANPKFMQTAGYTREEAMGQHAPVFRQEYLDTASHNDFLTTISSGNTWLGEIENRNGYNDSSWEHTVVSPIRNSRGDITHFVTVTEDITERKRLLFELQHAKDELEHRIEKRTAELKTANRTLIEEVNVRRRAQKALHTAQRHLELALAGAELGTWDVNLVTGNVVSNERAAKMLGYLPTEMFSHLSAWHSAYHPDDRNAAIDAWQKHIDGKTEQFQTTSRMKTKSGGYVWILSRGKVFEFDSNNVPQRVAGTFLDVTDRKNAEAQVAAERHNLERTVELRTRQLREYLEQLEEANQHKTRFLSSMSHELRTPLNGILGFADLLTQQFFGPLNEKQLHYVQLIDQSGKHLLALITDLLDIAKIDAGRMELQWQDFVPLEYINSCITMVDSQVKQKEITLFIHPFTEDMHLFGDTKRCKQILLNILTNAVKFTPNGGNIDIYCEKQDDKTIKISVSDTGPGIEPQKQELIFSEFYQAEQVRDAELGGTGIGLSLTRRLVKMHGGTIGVKSRVGEGSTFYFSLPAREKSVKKQKEKDVSRDAQVLHPVHGKVLLAEDNDVNLTMLLDMLSVRDISAIVARNGLEVIDLAMSEKPELILMDIRMPEMNGIDATRRLRAIPRFNDVPIIALTASADDQSIRECFEAGCTAHLPKPVQMKQLFDLIDRYLKETPQSDNTAHNTE